MEAAYQPELWQNLYIALCGASAALTGLLFISTSLHVEEVMNVPILRVRASGAAAWSTMMIIEAAIVLLPQSYAMIGLELFIWNLAGLIWQPVRVTFRMLRGTIRAKPDPLRFGWVCLIAIVGTAGGLSLWLKSGGGLYLVTAHFFLDIGFVVAAAWSVMVDVGRDTYREAT
jgi:hypothetical protein